MQLVKRFLLHLTLAVIVFNLTISIGHLLLQGNLPLFGWILLPWQTAFALDIICVLWFRGITLVKFSSPFPSVKLRAYSVHHFVQLRKCHYCHSLAKAKYMHIGFPYNDSSRTEIVHLYKHHFYLCKHHFSVAVLKLGMENEKIEEDPDLPKWWASITKELSPKEKLHAS